MSRTKSWYGLGCSFLEGLIRIRSSSDSHTDATLSMIFFREWASTWPSTPEGLGAGRPFDTVHGYGTTLSIIRRNWASTWPSTPLGQGDNYCFREGLIRIRTQTTAPHYLWSYVGTEQVPDRVLLQGRGRPLDTDHLINLNPDLDCSTISSMIFRRD